MKFNIKIIIISFFLIINAYSYCVLEPREPHCVDSYGKWSNYEFNNCKREVERFIEDSIKYAECRNQKAICKFNCKASGDTYCRC